MDDLGKLNYRWNMVRYAQRNGISKTAEVYNTSRRTVRKWVKRYQEGGSDALSNKSRTDQYFPNKIPENIRKSIIEFRKNNPSLGARFIKDYLELHYSQVTINKKLKQA